MIYKGIKFYLAENVNNVGNLNKNTTWLELFHQRCVSEEPDGCREG